MANVIIKSSLIYNNTSASLSSVQIDFANGQGFVNIPLNVAVNAAYTDTGYYRWTIKATLSNSTVLQCYADYYVEHIPPVSNITPLSYEPDGVNGPQIAGTGTSNVWGNIDAVPGVHSGGTIHIVYSNKNRTNSLRKPLIVVENMDAYNLAPQVQSRPYTISEFIKDLSEPGTSFDFNSQLDDVAGYDLVFINFNDGMDGIVRNAAVVQEAINRINVNKVPDDRNDNIIQQNVVMGIGTGGLNARYALANMAKNFSGSNTRLLITHDAPHRGQNIAVGLQYLVKFINKSNVYNYNIGQVFPEHGQTMAYFKSQVCKDVLIYQTSDIDNTVALNSFIENVYQPMVTFSANNQPYQFVATSLGNECATPLFEAGRKFMDFGSQTAVGIKIKVSLGLLIGRSHRMDIGLFSIPISELKYETIVFARSIPTQITLPGIITAYTYNYKFTLLNGSVIVDKDGVDEVAIAGTNLLPIDGVPGSFHTLMDFTELRRFQNSFYPFSFSYDEYITTLFKIPIKKILGVKFSLYGFFKASMYNSGIFNTNYTSIPVGSALDVSPFNTSTFTQKYVNGVNSNYPSKSNNFIAQESVTSQGLYNNASMRFTARNARFLFNEMEGLPNYENCSNECSNPFLISGSNTICTSGSFSIPGLPTGASVAWTVSPSNIADLSCTNCLFPSLTKVNNGKVMLTATVTNACFLQGLQVQSEITIGTPSPYIGGTFNDGGSGGNQPLEGTVNEVLNTTVYISLSGSPFQFTWENFYTNGNVSWYHPTVGNEGLVINFYPPPIFYGDYIGFDINRTNICGTASEPLFFYYAGPTQYYRVAPNPVQSTFTITQLEQKKLSPLIPKKKEVSKDLIKIQIIDKMGKQVFEQSFSNFTKSATINVSALKADIYTVRVFTKDHEELHKIVVQH